MRTCTRSKRTGAVLPLVVLCSVVLIGMLALAIDIGMVAIARTQCQNAADAAAMAGARTINGNADDDYNLAAVPESAITAAVANSVLAEFVDADPDNIQSLGNDTYQSGQVKIQAGAYTYTYNDADPSQEGFSVQIPRTDTDEPYSAVRATVSYEGDYAFGRIFGQTAFNTRASATAVHRPRDVVIVIDLSGSMRFQSLPGIPYSGNRTTSMNPDPSYPKFGHYADTTGAALYGNSQIETGAEIAYYDPANIGYETDSGPAILEYFFSNAVGTSPSAGNRAFTRETINYQDTPGGDNFLKKELDDGDDYAHTVEEFNNDSSTTNARFEVHGYAEYRGAFSGYTQGPGYWGKTFWVWPPNPCGLNVTEAPSSLTDTSFNWYNNGSRDWRQRFFVAVNTTANPDTPAWVMHNRILFDTDGHLRVPGDTISISETVNGSTASTTYTYRINYAAILYWLTQGPNPFPSTIQAGRIRYYSSIPSGADNALNNRWWTTNPSTLDNDEKFWKSYIDFVLGFSSYWDGSQVVYYSTRSYIGNGSYFEWDGSDIDRDDHPQPQPPSTRPSDPYMTGTTGPHQVTTTDPHQTTTTGPYMTGTTSSSRSSGATSVPVNTLAYYPAGNINTVRFGNSTSTYTITNSSKTNLSISPGLSGSVSSGTQVKIFSSSNAAGKNRVSVNDPPNSITTNSDYIGFNNSSSTFYKIAASQNLSAGYQFTLSTNLTSSVGVNGVSAQIYASNGSVNSTLISVDDPPDSITVNSDYIGFGGNDTNVYKITGDASRSAGHILTLASPGLVTAVGINGTSAEIYASNGAVGATKVSVTGLSQTPVANRDYVIFGDDAENPYLITAATSRSNGHILTVEPLAAAVDINGATAKIYSPYMEYDDDVMRPKHHFWFGPQTWVDWLGNYNMGQYWWPGNVPEAQAWSCKVGIQTAIDDIKKNHPSDYLALAFFSHPTGKRSNGNWYDGYHNRHIVPLGRNYSQLKESLWFPPTTVTAGVEEIGPYDTDFRNTPRAVGGTTPEMGFMLAYNILSNSVENLRLHTEPDDTYRGNAGGLGRKGASRLIIFETDGAPNRCAAANFNDQSADSYYSIRLKDPTNVYDDQNEVPTVSTTNSYDDASAAAYEIVKQICKDESQSGFSTARKPVQVYSLGYGSLFESANAGSGQDDAKAFLQTVQYHGGTATTTNADDFPDSQLVYGTSAERIERMRVAFTNIMQKGVQVSLIE